MLNDVWRVIKIKIRLWKDGRVSLACQGSSLGISISDIIELGDVARPRWGAAPQGQQEGRDSRAWAMPTSY